MLAWKISMLNLFIVHVPLQQENTASLCKAFILSGLATVTFTPAYQLGHADYWKHYEGVIKWPAAAAVYPSEAREENVSSCVILFLWGTLMIWGTTSKNRTIRTPWKSLNIRSFFFFKKKYNVSYPPCTSAESTSLSRKGFNKLFSI